MGLKKLRSLSITLASKCGYSDRLGDLSKLQEHPTLKDIRLILDWEEEDQWLFFRAVSLPLTKGLCSFFATQQLKVLNLVFNTQAEVKILFLVTLTCVPCNLQEARTSQYHTACGLVTKGRTILDDLLNLPHSPQTRDGVVNKPSVSIELFVNTSHQSLITVQPVLHLCVAITK